MRKMLYIIAAGLGLSCAAASAASLHIPQPSEPVYIRTGSGDGAGFAGAEGGKAGKPGATGSLRSALRGFWGSGEGDGDGDRPAGGEKLYEYCSRLADDVRRGEAFPEANGEFLPSDCVDIFIVPFGKTSGERHGKDSRASYDEDLFSYCVDLLRQARRDAEGLPGYKGRRRTYANDFSPRECAEYFLSLEMSGKGGFYGLKHNGMRGLGLYGGVGGEAGKAGRGLFGGRGGDGGDGIGGGVGGKGGRGGDDLSSH